MSRAACAERPLVAAMRADNLSARPAGAGAPAEQIDQLGSQIDSAFRGRELGPLARRCMIEPRLVRVDAAPDGRRDTPSRIAAETGCSSNRAFRAA